MGEKSRRETHPNVFRVKFAKRVQLCQEVHFGIAVLDADLHYVELNEGMAALNGRSLKEHLGRTMHEVEPFLGSVVAPVVRYAVEEGKALVEVEAEVVHPSEEGRARYWLISSYPIFSVEEVVGAEVVVRDVTDQKLKEVAQNELLKFEELLSELSAEFINVATSDVDAKVVQGLSRINDFLGYDRISVWQFRPEDGKLCLTHSHSLPDIKQPPPVIDDIVPMWVNQARQGEVVTVDDVEELPDNFWREKKYCRDQGGLKSMFFIPLRVGGKILGIISITSYRCKAAWIDQFIQRLRLLGAIVANSLERKRADQKIQTAFAEIEDLKDRLQAENLLLRDQIDLELKHEEIVGESPALRQVLLQAKQVAPTDSTVLILGETGTGKELLAREIHDLSPRKDRPMIKLNCAALPATLIEAELFGREKGAYTGAVSRQIGRFEAANGSTIFLDEIGELPLELQAKLLRVLQEGQIERLGSNIPVKVDVRVIAATNRDLAQSVKEGRFRQDLFYRLNVFPIMLPPLRQRKEDVPLLVWSIVREFGKSFGKNIESISRKNMDALELYPWPGNIRELRNVIERAMILNNGPTLVVDLPNSQSQAAPPSLSLQSVERAHILAVLERTGWRVRGKNGAAELLELNPSTLCSRMRKLAIKRKVKANDISL